MIANIKVGDKVTVQFPDSALRVGGDVIGVITVPGKEISLTVQFSYGAHQQFPVSNVITHVSI